MDHSAVKEILVRLIDLSEKGKIQWQPVGPGFQAKVGTNEFTIRREESGYIYFRADDEDRKVFDCISPVDAGGSLSGTASIGYLLSHEIRRLYELASQETERALQGILKDLNKIAS